MLNSNGVSSFKKRHSVHSSLPGKVQWTPERSSVAAVKVLKKDASADALNDFLGEIKIMSAFKHDHILSLMGLVEAGIPPTHAIVYTQ